MSVDLDYELRETVVALDDVALSLGGRPVLTGVSAAIRNIHRPGLQQGQVVAVVGPSGVGKTQLCRVLAGLQRPDRGSVRVGVDQHPVRVGDVGVVLQRYPLFRHRTVRGNLVVAARQGGRADPDAAALELLARFGLADRVDAWPGELSGGQRQRVAIAQQLLCSDHLLLMDEPFSGLDPRAKAAACRLILDVSRIDELNTIVVVTHDLEAAVGIADEVWVLGGARDAEGRSTCAATIVERVDLKARGIAWREDRRELPRFRDTVRELTTRFATL